MNAETAANLSALFDVGGIIGGILAGIAIDLTGKPATTCSVMLLAAIPSVSLTKNIFFLIIRGGASEASGAPSCSALVRCNWGKIVKIGASEASH